MNKNAYDKLSPELKNVLTTVGNKYVARCTDFGFDLEDKSREKFQKMGIKFTKPTAKDLEQAREKILPFWNEWTTAKGPAAVQALKDVRQALGR
jgi:TRAP-type C4-dicarboxylate transport system substrate-binding protein